MENDEQFENVPPHFVCPITKEIMKNPNMNEAQVIMDGSLSAWSEKLPPFNVMPTVVLQKGSNAVLGAAVKTIQRIFMNNLMGDYEKWATDPTCGAERAASKSAADAQKTVPV
eukprot:jgi/Bigna1/146680/aug1.119_g21388